jgi:hypothetical protein
MKPTQTLAEAQNQLFASIRSLAEHTVFRAYSPCSNFDKDILAKAQQNFLNAVRTYAEALVYDAYSRYDPYDGGEFLTHEAYEEILKSIEDDEVIPMEEVAEELGIKW